MKQHGLRLEWHLCTNHFGFTPLKPLKKYNWQFLAFQIVQCWATYATQCSHQVSGGVYTPSLFQKQYTPEPHQEQKSFLQGSRPRVVICPLWGIRFDSSSKCKDELCHFIFVSFPTFYSECQVFHENTCVTMCWCFLFLGFPGTWIFCNKSQTFLNTQVNIATEKHNTKWLSSWFKIQCELEHQGESLIRFQAA